MCLAIYISSLKELPEIRWNENSPEFYLLRVTNEEELKMLSQIFNSPFIYQALSFMGCSCGLSYGDWSLHNENENHQQRINDVQSMKNFLTRHKNNNAISIFCTMWEEFYEHYEQKEFNLPDIHTTEFQFEEMIILNLS